MAGAAEMGISNVLRESLLSSEGSVIEAWIGV
jgi:hypothetical protein